MWLCIAFVASISIASASEMTSAPELEASAGWHTLRLGPVPFLDYGFDTRGYNGRIQGPTFRVKPGEQLQVHLYNDLNPAHNFGCDVTGTEYCESETTNMHTHGLHVSSNGTDENQYSSDSIFTAIPPGENARYVFQIPSHHAPGTHWYHPHHHHATSMQTGGGAAGVIIVDDPPGYLPPAYMKMEEMILFVSYFNFETLQQVALDSKATILSNAANVANAMNRTEGAYLINAQFNPRKSVRSGRWLRLRIVFAAVSLQWDFELRGTRGDPVCEMQLLSKDGIYLDQIPRKITHAPLFPGARADIAIMCTCASFPCTVATNPIDRPEFNIMTWDILSDPNNRPGLPLPEFTPVKPCYLADLRNAVVPTTNVGVLRLDGGGRRVQWNGEGESMTYANIHADGKTMKDWPPIGTFQAGSVQEMEVTGGINGHPLHLHVNPYQIVTLPNGAVEVHDDFIRVGDWHDTLQIPELGGRDDVTIRTQMDIFTGKLVVHCHFLHHEDEGMMGFFSVAGTEGAEFQCSKSLDTKCYTAAFHPNEDNNHPVDPVCIASSVASSFSQWSPMGMSIPWQMIGVVTLLVLSAGCYFTYARLRLRRNDQSSEDVETAELQSARQ